MKIYLASSWRNTYYPKVLERLYAEGFEVYDFRNQEEYFSWKELFPDHATNHPTFQAFKDGLNHKKSQEGFDGDVLVVNDHGNMSLYNVVGGIEVKEYWSIV